NSGVMYPPQPQLSLPTPHNETLYGASCPFFRRISVSVLLPLKFKYSIQFSISCGVPVPTFPAIYGSHPNSLHNFKNSSVPKLLSSVTMPQVVFTRCGLLLSSPIPSLQ